MRRNIKTMTQEQIKEMANALHRIIMREYQNQQDYFMYIKDTKADDMSMNRHFGNVINSSNMIVSLCNRFIELKDKSINENLKYDYSPLIAEINDILMQIPFDELQALHKAFSEKSKIDILVNN